MTWIDPVSPGKKIDFRDPETGKPLPSKKIRGSKRQAKIYLGTGLTGLDAPCSRLVISEGIETGLSAMIAEQDRPQAKLSEYWAAIDLYHLAGKSTKTISHPTLKKTDKNGRKYPVKVPGPWPKPDPDRDLMPPAQFSEIVILGDGDSEPFMTHQAILRAAIRWDMPGRKISTPFADAGKDFNEMLMEGAA